MSFVRKGLYPLSQADAETICANSCLGCVTLYAWGRLQEPEVRWQVARELAETGKIEFVKLYTRGYRRHATLYVPVDQAKLEADGLIAAVRWAGWHRVPDSHPVYQAIRARDEATVQPRPKDPRVKASRQPAGDLDQEAGNLNREA